MGCAAARSGAFAAGLAAAAALGGCSSDEGRGGSNGGETSDAALDTTDTPAPEPISLTIATFNVRRAGLDLGENAWEVRRERAATMLEARDPDVVGLQEALPQQRDDLLERLPAYDAFGDGRLVDRTGEEVTVLWRSDRLERLDGSTFWLSETPNEPGSVGWDGLFPRICTWARFAVRDRDETFYVFNVHLDNEGATARLEGARLAITRIRERDPTAPVFLTGDFNAPENSEPVAVVSTDLVDAFRAVHPDATDAGTFHVFAGITDGPRIDYVFASRDVTVLDAAVWSEAIDGAYVSDHHPVGARFELPLE